MTAITYNRSHCNALCPRLQHADAICHLCRALDEADAFVQKYWNRPWWCLWQYSGAREICALVNPNWEAAIDPKPSTFIFWVISIMGALFSAYAAAFGLASGRYESRLDQIENRATGIYAQVGSKQWKAALERVPQVQRMSLPEQPDIRVPLSIYRSLFHKPKPGATDYLIQDLKELIVSFANDDLSQITLRRADLKGITLDKVNLSKAWLDGSDLRGVNFNDTTLEDASLSQTDLSRANLNNVNLSRANLNKTKLILAVLQEANFSQAKLNRADLYGAFLFKANLSKAWGSKSDLSKAYLGEANLQEVRLHQTIFIATGLRGANLRKADLTGSDLRGADLSETNLYMANLSGANLSRPDPSTPQATTGFLVLIDYSRMKNSTKEHKKVFNTGADLRKAYLAKTNLQGTDLSGTKNWTAKQLTAAWWNQQTKWPEGFKPPCPQNTQQQPCNLR